MTADTEPLSPFVSTERNGAARVAMLVVWVVLVAWLAAHHVFWRDEVRAFTIALSGDGVIGMVRALQGEGHPALWYLLLRIVHDIVPAREVLPVVGLAIGLAAAALFAWRAPFRPLVLAVSLFGAWIVQEYTVMARNYGISALLMFVIADRMGVRRCPPWLFGALLFLLCSTNVPSILFAAGFLLFRLVEIVREDGFRLSPALRGWALAAALATLGVIAAFFEVYPPWNDAAAATQPDMSVLRVLASTFDVAGRMYWLFPEWIATLPGAMFVLAVLVIALPFSLRRSPGGFIAAIVVLPVLLLFFQLVYGGGYRHQALYIVFVLALHWMVAKGRGGHWSSNRPLPIASLAGTLALLLLAIQVVPTATLLWQSTHGVVASRSPALGALLRRPDLRDAIVIAEPDSMIEPLSYYAPNPTYLIREEKFGRIMRFTRHARLVLTLDDILATARRLRATTGKPVVIVMGPRLDPSAPADRITDSYGTTFVLDSAAIGRFFAATRRIARFDPAVTDESYDVFLLRPSAVVKPRVTAS